MANYIKSSILKSVEKYLASLIRVRPFAICLMDRLSVRKGRVSEVCVRKAGRFTIRNGTNDLSEVVAVALGYEYPRCINTFLKASGVSAVIDCGAHIGTFSVTLAVQNPKIVVYAYEPEPDNFKLLKRNIDANGLGGRVIATQAAIASEGGSCELFLSKSNNGHSLMSTSNGHHSITVEAIDLENCIGKIDAGGKFAIKMDIEGAEYDILEKSRKQIANAEFIVLEWHFGTQGERVEKYSWLGAYFRELGFKEYLENCRSKRVLFFYRR